MAPARFGPRFVDQDQRRDFGKISLAYLAATVVDSDFINH
jgi:hypothetical protein